MSKGTGRVYAQLTMVAAIWGGVFIVVKDALANIGPMKMAAIRFAIATLVLFPLVAHREPAALHPARANWLPLIITGIVSVFIYQWCFFQGMRYSNSINASLVIAANPMMTALLAALILRERLRTWQKVGIALSFLGEVVVVSEGSLDNLIHLRFNRGDLLLLVAVVSWAFNSLYIRHLGDRISPLTLSAWSCLIGGLLLIPFGWVETPAGLPKQWTWQLTLAIAYVAVPATALASIWWFDGLVKIGPSRASVFVNLCPVFTVFFMFLLGREIFRNQLVGAVMVICGVYLTTRNWSGTGSRMEDRKWRMEDGR